MAKKILGYFYTFNHESQDWILYKDRLEQWFFANDLSDKEDKFGVKRRAILLSSLAETTYRLIRNLALPENVGTMKYTDVVELLDGHFKSKTCGFAERHNFHRAVQNYESLADWAVRVRGLAMHCGFPTSTLNEMLRDRFVLGMAYGPERDRLFGEDLEGFTLEKALHLAESVRCAREGAREGSSLVGTTAFTAAPEFEVHKIAMQSAGSRPTFHHELNEDSNKHADQCLTCGYYGHLSNRCRFRNIFCSLCGLKGHLKRVCKLNEVSRNVRYLEYCSDNDERCKDGKRVVFNVCTRGSTHEPLRNAELVDKVTLSFELDSGSDVTLISETDYNQYFEKTPLRPSKRGLLGYTGFSIRSIGVMTVPFTYNDETKNVDVFVIRKGGSPLLGRDFMAKFNLVLSQGKSYGVAAQLNNDMEQRTCVTGSVPTVKAHRSKYCQTGKPREVNYKSSNNQSDLMVAHLTARSWPSEPWYEVYLELLGPWFGKVYLIAVDAYSKWVEVFDISSDYHCSMIIGKLRELMSRFGQINTIFTDNNSSFVSREFKNFCLENGITQLFPPSNLCNSASNEQTENCVENVKWTLKCLLLRGIHNKGMDFKLYEYLFTYRNTKQLPTDRSPAEILYGKNLCCKFVKLKPPTSSSSESMLSNTVTVLQGKCIRGRRNVDLTLGETVYVRVYRRHVAVWGKGVIIGKKNKSTFLVNVCDYGRIVKRHRNQIYECKELCETSASSQRDTSQSVVHTAVHMEETEQNMPPFICHLPKPNHKVVGELVHRTERAHTPEEPWSGSGESEIDADNWMDCEDTLVAQA